MLSLMDWKELTFVRLCLCCSQKNNKVGAFSDKQFLKIDESYVFFPLASYKVIALPTIATAVVVALSFVV